jgi:hypothetical protein
MVRRTDPELSPQRVRAGFAPAAVNKAASVTLPKLRCEVEFHGGVNGNGEQY